LDLFGGLLGAGLIRGNVIDRYIVAIVGELESDGFANASGRARDDCYSTDEALDR
jgi:hypothetical protein